MGWREVISGVREQPLVGAYLDARLTATVFCPGGYLRVVEDGQYMHGASAVDTPGRASEDARWQILRGGRIEEAHDSRLTRQEPAQNLPSGSFEHCQWKAPTANETISNWKVAQSINSHLFEHFREITFVEAVRTRSAKSRSFERIIACGRQIYYQYQSSMQVRSIYESIQEVRSMWSLSESKY